MATIKPINQYQVHLVSHPQFNEWLANIILRQNHVIVADVRFVADPALWIGHTIVNPNGVSQFYVSIDRYPWFLDVLRHERPLFVVLYPPSGTLPGRMLLQTSVEPVGESE